MKNIFLTFFVLFTLTFVGCKPDDIVEPDIEVDEVQTMKLDINHVFGEASLEFGTEFILPSLEKVNFSRLDYILSDFYLVKTDDTKVNLEGQYALIKALRSDSRTFSEVPMGDYKAIGFSIGLDSSVNHGNPNQYNTEHTLSPINNSLHWSWEGGYIFTALEGKTIANDESFIYHLAGYRNKTDFELPVVFNKGKAALNAYIEYDVSEIFKNPTVYNISMDGASSHSTSDPVTAKLFRNMADVFTVKSITE